MAKTLVNINLWIDHNSGTFDAFVLTTMAISVFSLIKFIFISLTLLSIVIGFAFVRRWWNKKEVDLRDYFSIPA